MGVIKHLKYTGLKYWWSYFSWIRIKRAVICKIMSNTSWKHSNGFHALWVSDFWGQLPSCPQFFLLKFNTSLREDNEFPMFFDLNMEDDSCDMAPSENFLLLSQKHFVRWTPMGEILAFLPSDFWMRSQLFLRQRFSVELLLLLFLNKSVSDFVLGGMLGQHRSDDITGGGDCSSGREMSSHGLAMMFILISGHSFVCNAESISVSLSKSIWIPSETSLTSVFPSLWEITRQFPEFSFSFKEWSLFDPLSPCSVWGFDAL